VFLEFATMWQVYMSVSRWDRIATMFSEIDPSQPLGTRLSVLACEVVGTTMAAIAMSSGSNYVPIGASNDIARTLIDPQFTVGDGPAVEAVRTGTPVLAGDLTTPSADAQWPAFIPLALQLGIQSAFAFPLGVGAAQLGVVTAFHPTPIVLDPETVADAMVMATLASDAIVAMQAGKHELGEVFSANFTNGGDIHQAAGMVSEQLGISIVDALVRLRSHAYASNTPLSAIARRVINGQLTLDP
jgi:hypothetical protein